MSSLIVEVCRIENLSTHPNAEKLELARVKGWQVCVPKGRYSAGDSVVYIPIDSLLPVALSDRLGITKYLSNGRDILPLLRSEISATYTESPPSRSRTAGRSISPRLSRPRKARV